jgi:hypothetical protein
LNVNVPAADLTLAQRVMAPTPKFFRLLRTIGVVIGLLGEAILASPLALPVVVITVGGYLALAGSIVTGGITDGSWKRMICIIWL